MTSLITGVAASLSIATSEYLSTKSEGEGAKNPLRAAVYTGFAYALTVLLLIFPYLILANAYACLGLTMLDALLVIFLFTYYISVARDLPFGRRFLKMALISLGVAGLIFAMIGEKFPQLEVRTTKGKLKLPDDYKGRWFILFSHPADFTPVCTTEFVAFQKRYEEFQKLQCDLIGLSIDKVFTHLKWEEWIKENIGVEIQFPIIADNTGEISARLGMRHKQARGTQTVRAVFIVDPQGIIRAILYYPMELGRNMDEILRMVKRLQIADKGYAIPANWPNNEIIGDHVIVPPASTVDTIKKRREQEKAGEIECLDWWLCHKK